MSLSTISYTIEQGEVNAPQDIRPTFVPFRISDITDPNEKRLKMRLNCLGSLYYFIHIGLRRKRLVYHLHGSVCNYLERDHIKDVYEFPRDHFKSTICSEGLPMWRSLPISDDDLNAFSKAGYSTEFTKWLQRKHNPSIRNLLVSENITNAAKLGTRIRTHYESNSIFRWLFPEILPTSDESWGQFSLQHRIPAKAGGAEGHGEGTFDFLGVGGALQSRHYSGLVIQDDLVGMKARESVSVMSKTIDYHRLVSGAFEEQVANDDLDELIVGNRWAFNDLNSWIRENESEFYFSTHSALGGCCPMHPPDTPIFPEEWSFDKLMRRKNRLGTYLFSCQYLNNPAAPENADFKSEWLRYFSLEWDDVNKHFTIHHEVEDGIVKKDLSTKLLNICLVTDPNHSGAEGRCRHSIAVVGLSSEGNYYLLGCWAEAIGTDPYVQKIYDYADKWKLYKFGLETIAAQKYLAQYINLMNRLNNRTLRIVELKGEVEGPDGQLTRHKEWRIRNVLSPIFESGRFFTQRKFTDFYGEYTTFPKGMYVDILDALAYAPQMLKLPQSFLDNLKWQSRNASDALKIRAPYSVGGR